MKQPVYRSWWVAVYLQTSAWAPIASISYTCSLILSAYPNVTCSVCCTVNVFFPQQTWKRFWEDRDWSVSPTSSTAYREYRMKDRPGHSVFFSFSIIMTTKCAVAVYIYHILRGNLSDNFYSNKSLEAQWKKWNKPCWKKTGYSVDSVTEGWCVSMKDGFMTVRGRAGTRPQQKVRMVSFINRVKTFMSRKRFPEQSRATFM